ncbi:MAG: hypothetical protein LAN62_11720 [Acidobacteriia bacterium]|nr:hypothetical protein [Terriglobia bacterium]
MPAILVLVLVTVAFALDVLGISGVVATMAEAAFFAVPAIFIVSLVWGLSSRSEI